MALQSFTVSIGALTDANNNGKNYVSGEAIYVKTIGGTFAPIFRDLAGTSEIAQDGLANQTNEKGQFKFFVEAGDYVLEYQSQSTPVTIVGADYFNNRVEETVNQIIIDTATSRGFRVVGDFASGFTYELANDVAIDGSGNYWVYADINALPVVVTAGTTPSAPTYTQTTFSQASAVTTTAGINAQEFIDNFELKIFQSPTDNLTKVSTFAGGVGVVYEVRKTSDNSLATIYSDKEGVTEIVQNDIVNVSNGDAEAVFYIAAGDYSVTINVESEFFSVSKDMSIISSLENFAAGSKPSTGGTRWLINDVSGLPLPNGLFARPLNGIFLDDFGVDSTGVDSVDDALDNAILSASYVGGKVKARGGNSKYLITRQHTILHGVGLDFNYSEVNFIQSTTNNDSPFQMGSNTELKNISKGTYSSTSSSPFSTLGWVKVGEFYSLIDGSPSSGDNSVDSTYWEVDNVLVDNVHADMSEQANEDSRGFGKTVGHYSATNCTYKNIGCDGLCQDGKPSKHTLATVRTETGVDINEGRQGYNLIIENIKGSNLRAQAENAVVYVNGDRNTSIKNVYGESCGGILGIRPNRLLSTQDQSMQGRSGLNITAENITGVNCRKEASDTSANTLSAVYLHSNEGDVISNNKSSFVVKNVAVFSTAVIADKLPLGIQIGDAVPFPNETGLGCRRISLEGFEVVGFIDGINEEDGSLSNRISNGFVSMCEKNGGNLNGARSTYENIKSWRNNQGSQPDANNGHGMRIACKQGVFISCNFGDESLGAGNETQKSALYISDDDTTATLKSCYFDNYKTGELVLGARVVTGSSIYVDQFCKSKFVTVSKASEYHLSPDAVKASGIFNTAGATQYELECTVSKASTGKYNVTFTKPMANTSYRVIANSNFQYCNQRTTLKTVNGFQLAARDDAGLDVDTGFDFNVYGDYSTL